MILAVMYVSRDWFFVRSGVQVEHEIIVDGARVVLESLSR